MLRQLPHLLTNVILLLERVVHAVPDELIHLLVRNVAQREFAVHPVALRGAYDAAGDNDGDVANAADVRVEPVGLDLFRGEGGGEGFGGGVDHILGDADGLAEDGSQADAGEDCANVG